MKKEVTYLLILFILYSCNNSKWEIIRGNGINDEAKSIDRVIYFENENNGVIGGYELVIEGSIKWNADYTEIPILYLTKDGGKNWTKIHFDSTVKQSIKNAYLHLDTLICQTDSLILFSTDKGLNFRTYKESPKRNVIIGKYFQNDRYEIKNHKFDYNGNEYYIKENFQNDLASVIVCYGSETIRNYYFVSFNHGKTWTFLQKDFGDNRQRFLLGDKFLYCYDFSFGLQRLSLK
jgi:hypothetical protein